MECPEKANPWSQKVDPQVPGPVGRSGWGVSAPGHGGGGGQENVLELGREACSPWRLLNTTALCTFQWFVLCKVHLNRKQGGMDQSSEENRSTWRLRRWEDRSEGARGQVQSAVCRGQAALSEQRWGS